MPSLPFRPGRRTVLRAIAASSIALFLPYASGSGPIRRAMAETEDGAIPLAIPSDVSDGEQWVDVNLTEQAAVAMVGYDWVHVALATTGKDGWETPEGHYRIVRRVYNETMTSAALNITDPSDQYVLTDVLFTQYFTWEGHALHLNYWRPDSVFGYERTSHGCVGLRMGDARFFWDHLVTGSRVVVHA